MAEQITSHEIFAEFACVKPALATEFIGDYLLYELNIANNFNDIKYKNVYKFILDFMVACDPLLKFYLRYIEYSKEEFTLERFGLLFKELQFNEESTEFFYGVFLANMNKIMMIKNKRNGEFDKDEVRNYKMNIQMELGHSSLSAIDNEFNVMIDFQKNASKSYERQIKPSESYENLFQVNEKDLDSIILKLKEIYSTIKS